ncbi:MAG: hypothetical protein HGA45_31175 [Chloroflexales bacterium]|nr:hypothetical protein [Chloroflexales bacterium]
MTDAPADDPITALTAAASGLLVPSEADAPLEPFRWACPPTRPSRPAPWRRSSPRSPA